MNKLKPHTAVLLQKLWLSAFLLIQSMLLLYFVSIFFEPRGADFESFITTTIIVMVFFIVLYLVGTWWMKWMFQRAEEK